MDIISLGIDTSGFSPEKEETLKRFIALFEKLSTFDGKIMAPVMGGGLLEFNNSILATSKLLDDINIKFASFNVSANATGVSSSKAAKGTKELTEEEARLKVQIQESNKALLEKAKAENIGVQARQNAKKLAKEQYDLETAGMNQHKSDSALIQRMIKQDVDAETASANQQKKNSDAIAALKKQQQKESDATAKAQQKEANAAKALTSDYALLRQALRDQEVAYTNLLIAKGKNDPSTKAAAYQYSVTAQTVSDIDKQLVKAGGSATNLGVQLTHGLSVLRNLAYILPGIGLAGIFDLAFQAIGNVISSLFGLDEGLIKIGEREIKLNDSIKEQYNLLKSVIDQREKLIGLASGQSAVSDKGALDVAAAEGFDRLRLQQKKVDLAIKEYQDAASKLPPGLSPAESEKEINRLINIQKQLGETKKKYDEFANAKDSKSFKEKLGDFADLFHDLPQTPSAIIERYNKLRNKQVEGVELKYNQAELESITKQLGSEIELRKSQSEEKLAILQNYSDKDIAMRTATQEQVKIIEDEERKRTLTYAKDDLELDINKNERILNAEISSEQKRINALRRIRDDRIKENKAELQNVLTNISSTPYEKELAQRRLGVGGTENIKIIQESLEKENILRESFRQRRLTATLKINEAEVNQDAIKNEKIANNESNNLDERLSSLVTYIQKRQALQDLQYTREIDRLSLKTGDKTAQKEIAALEKQRIEQKANIQADVEKKTYDIVYSSLQKELKAVTDANEIESFVTKQAHIDALHEINEAYRKRLISYEKYKEAKEKIDIDFRRNDLKSAINEDRESILRLEVQLDEELRLKEKYDKEYEKSKDELEIRKLIGGNIPEAEKAFGIATGEKKGADQSITEAKKKLTEAQIKLRNDLLALESLTDKDPNKKRNEWIDAALRIEKALYNAIKEVGDATYEYRVAQVEKNKQLMDEQYGYEIDAINKSSLTAKDKAALDIQLQAEKMVTDKNAQAETRRIKIEEAEFDKKLAIANATIAIAAAIIRDGLTSPKAIADAAIGAIEIAKIAATPIPRYGEGTLWHKGGKAVIGEKGTEVIKEPYRSPWLVYKETFTELPVGTKVIPVKDHPEFGGSVAPDGWAQTKWLGKQIRKISQTPRITNRINIDLGFERYKRKQLYGK